MRVSGYNQTLLSFLLMRFWFRKVERSQKKQQIKKQREFKKLISTLF